MALSPGPGLADPPVRDHGFHELRVRTVVPETDDARSFVLDIPPELAAAYAYQPGQFLTFRCWVGGEPRLRCYSMSSAPETDRDLQVTIKRVPGGVVSNWAVDSLAPGATIEATLPSGVFGRRSQGGDILAFAGGSGITPVLSVIKAVLEGTRHRARLFYANRDAGSVIFGPTLTSLAERYDGRLEVVHHLDTDRGLVVAGEIEEFAPGPSEVDCYVCGPTPFMELVETILLERGTDSDAIHIERFTPREENAVPVAAPGDEGPVRMTIELDGRVEVADHRAGTTVLQTARQVGLSPPYSCEAGNCATCMAKLADGGVTMYTNNALTAQEVADGWILTCQAVPCAPSLHVVYGWEA